ncbi:MAG: hypothetical protein HY660_09595 [Armatimonadetes bacterium]|nr:hypothetical protein [Armatimonadota bacterium]
MMGEQRHLTTAIILIVIGVLWYVHGLGRITSEMASRLGFLVPLIIGAYLVYLWYSHRRGEGRASPWLLGVGLLLILDTVDGWFGFDVRFAPTLFVVVGLVLLLDKKAA